jgi:aminoglycoside phosphotransferase (APT) family kinase protein
MGVLERDPEATADTLSRWLAEVAGEVDPVVSDVSIPGTTGWSNETVFFEATWGADSARATRRLVARIAPSGHQVFPEDTFGRQHAVMHALARGSGVPMVPVQRLEADPSWFGQPFFLMDRVDGDIPSDAPPYAGSGWLHDATPAQQERAWWSGVDALADVHVVDPASLALPPGTYPSAADPLAQHLDAVEHFLHWAEEGEPMVVARQALVALRADRPADPPEGSALCWGDARFSNLVYRDFEVVAVLDWEMSGIGDPLFDLGWWLFADETLTTGSGCTRLAGFPSRDETARHWSARTGRSAEALPWFELYAGLRFTVIMLRMGDLLADLGFVPPGFGRDNLVSQALEARLAEI